MSAPADPAPAGPPSKYVADEATLIKADSDFYDKEVGYVAVLADSDRISLQQFSKLGTSPWDWPPDFNRIPGYCDELLNREIICGCTREDDPMRQETLQEQKAKGNQVYNKLCSVNDLSEKQFLDLHKQQFQKSRQGLNVFRDFPKVCSVPIWKMLDKGVNESKGRWPGREFGYCFCYSALSKIARGKTLNCFPTATNTDMESVFNMTSELATMRSIMQDTNQSKTSKYAFCAFLRGCKPIYDDDKFWSNKFALEGVDITDWYEKPPKANFPVGVLCKWGLAQLLGDWKEFEPPHGTTVNFTNGERNEVAFSKEFYHCCIEPNKKVVRMANERVRSVADWFKNEYKAVLLRNMILEVAILHIICVVKQVPTGDVYMPYVVSWRSVYSAWKEGKLLPETKSIMLTPNTFANHAGVLKLLGNTEEKKGGRAPVPSLEIQIADHRLKYKGINGNDAHCIDLIDLQNYSGERVLTTGMTMQLPFNVTVCEVPKEFMSMLQTIKEREITQIIPTRSNQNFCGKTMQPYHPGMHTFLNASWLASDSGDSAFNTMLNNATDKDSLPTEDKYEEFVQNVKEKIEGAARDDKVKLKVQRIKCSYRQTRFSTEIKERTAPHLEFSAKCQSELYDECSGFIATCIIPIHKMGTWIRLFQHDQDHQGILIKIMKGTALVFPAALPVELGRCTHHEGNPHFAFHFVLHDEEKNCTSNPFSDAEEDTLRGREYVHFPNTVRDNGENDLRFVTGKAGKNASTHLQQWEKNSGAEDLDKYCGC